MCQTLVNGVGLPSIGDTYCLIVFVSRVVYIVVFIRINVAFKDSVRGGFFVMSISFGLGHYLFEYAYVDF